MGQDNGRSYESDTRYLRLWLMKQKPQVESIWDRHLQKVVERHAKFCSPHRHASRQQARAFIRSDIPLELLEAAGPRCRC